LFVFFSSALSSGRQRQYQFAVSVHGRAFEFTLSSRLLQLLLSDSAAASCAVFSCEKKKNQRKENLLLSHSLFSKAPFPFFVGISREVEKMAEISNDVCSSLSSFIVVVCGDVFLLVKILKVDLDSGKLTNAAVTPNLSFPYQSKIIKKMKKLDLDDLFIENHPYISV
jgi:hypothetical protein